ncbi:alpha/beta fold hydrolase [Paenibacillus hamazuiensis]|uniref:alpha/beta fold hydrolase n=1 Tax=Paenibacillus hamazuiensis TaxID=2936508 RepID=UPI00200DA854|nr:alpha/beta hydrolase [Paenibacillus hamazuiensis]
MMPFAEVNGTRLHYHVKGSGIPIVFIHPPLLSSRTFTYQQVQLSSEYKTIIFDIRGHGESAPSEVPLTYPLIAEDMKQLLDFLDIRQAYVCGYSAGGSIALEAMLAYPGRFRGGILISAMSETSDLYNKTGIWLATQLARLGASKLVAKAVTWTNSDMQLTHTNLYESAIKGDIRNHGQYYKYSGFYNCTNRLREIEQPILLLYGEKNSVFYKYARLLHHNLRNSTLYFLKDGKHHLPTKSADLLNECIHSWISELEGRPEEKQVPHHAPIFEETANEGEQLVH